MSESYTSSTHFKAHLIALARLSPKMRLTGFTATKWTRSGRGSARLSL